MCACLPVCKYVCMCVFVCAYIYIYIYIYIYYTYLYAHSLVFGLLVLGHIGQKKTCGCLVLRLAADASGVTT